MANGEFVSWEFMEKHLSESKAGFDRLGKVEAELMGDEETGRPSLRVELSRRIGKSNKILISILIVILARILLDWFVIEPKLAQLQTLELWKAQHDELTREQLRWKELPEVPHK